jgi:hypothetical protein
VADLDLTIIPPEVVNVTIDPPENFNSIVVNQVIGVAISPFSTLVSTIDNTTPIETITIHEGLPGSSQSTAIIETGGPTTLPIGRVAADSLLYRNNSSQIVGYPLSTINHAQSTGLIKGGILSLNANDSATFDLSELWGQIVDNRTDLLNPTVVSIHLPAQVGLPCPHINDSTTTYIGVDLNGHIFYQMDDWSAADRRNIIAIGWVDHPDHNTITTAYTEPYCVAWPIARLDGFEEDHGAFNVEGNSYGPSSVGGHMQLVRTAGVIHDNGTNYINDPTSPDKLVTDREDPVEFYYYFRNPDLADKWINPSDSVNIVDPNHWDDGTNVLATVPDDKWTIQLLSFYGPTISNDVQYGQKLYNTQADAIAGRFDPIVINPYDFADTFQGWLIVKKGCTDLNDETQAKFLDGSGVALNRVSGGGASGGGGGAGGGEVNTASNINEGGTGVFIQKIGVDLQFAGISNADDKTTVNYNSSSKTILVGTNLPKIMTSLNEPPDPTGIPDGTLYFMYT